MNTINHTKLKMAHLGPTAGVYTDQKLYPEDIPNAHVYHIQITLPHNVDLNKVKPLHTIGLLKPAPVNVDYGGTFITLTPINLPSDGMILTLLTGISIDHMYVPEIPGEYLGLPESRLLVRISDKAYWYQGWFNHDSQFHAAMQAALNDIDADTPGAIAYRFRQRIKDLYGVKLRYIAQTTDACALTDRTMIIKRQHA